MIENFQDNNWVMGNFIIKTDLCNRALHFIQKPTYTHEVSLSEKAPNVQMDNP